jgi:hypothetical protein
VVKKNSTLDMLTVMLDKIKVQFKVRPDVYKTNIPHLQVSNLYGRYKEYIAYCVAGRMSSS